MRMRFFQNSDGNVAPIFALSVLPLMGLAGAALDYSRASNERSALQSLVDSAALTAASPYAGVQDRAALAQSRFPSAQERPGLKVTTTVDGRTIAIQAEDYVETAMMGVLGIGRVRITAAAKAAPQTDGPPACILALNETANGALTIAGSASVVAKGCAVYSNSSSSSAISVQGSAVVHVGGMCAYGGVAGAQNVTPAPLSRCDRAPDPFRKLGSVDTSGCANNKVSVGPNETRTLNPGTYCNGLDIKGTATLNPGLYIVKGSLSVGSQARVAGQGVSFYLTGTGAGFDFNAGATINLSAMTGAGDPLKGMLIVQDRASNAGATNTLNGSSATRLGGAVYTPTQGITINGSSGFGVDNTYAPIVADQIKFNGSSTTQADVTAMPGAPELPKMMAGAKLTM
jgi:Flp pilus assembly protein TadG